MRRQTGGHCRLGVPYKVINVNRDPFAFQVDTGPIIFPDFAKREQHPVEMFELAYVLYSRFDEAEFVLRKPVVPQVLYGPTTYATDYSEVRVLPAGNEIRLGVPD